MARLVRASRVKPLSHLSFYGGDQWQAVFTHLADFPWMPLEISGVPHNVMLCFGEATDGRLVVTGLLIDPSANVEVSSRLLREIRVGEIAARASATPFPIGRVKQSGGFRMRRTARKDAPVELQRFAKAYEVAQRTHRRTPVRRVMSEFEISEATAHRWIARCRELGLLDQRPTKETT